MKKVLPILILIFSASTFSAHHEEGEKSDSEHTYSFAYTSTYTIPAGSQPQRIETVSYTHLTLPTNREV